MQPAAMTSTSSAYDRHARFSGRVIESLYLCQALTSVKENVLLSTPGIMSLSQKPEHSDHSDQNLRCYRNTQVSIETTAVHIKCINNSLSTAFGFARSLLTRRWRKYFHQCLGDGVKLPLHKHVVSLHNPQAQIASNQWLFRIRVVPRLARVLAQSRWKVIKIFQEVSYSKIGRKPPVHELARYHCQNIPSLEPSRPAVAKQESAATFSMSCSDRASQLKSANLTKWFRDK